MFSKRPTSNSTTDELVELVLARTREEFTVMPRFCFHQPLDYNDLTLAPDFGSPTLDAESGLAIPSPEYRFGYSPESTEHYLAWGKYDHDELLEVIRRYLGYREELTILDLGCSTGRVLRHFQSEWKTAQWKPYGCDIQAQAIQWLRSFFPDHFVVTTTSTLPHLPFADNTFDFIFGISVFTHIKYLWDAWLLELRRVMKPGAIMVQTIHAETAWEFYFAHRHEHWVRSSQPSRVFETPRMDVDFLHYGNAAVSQTFWRKEVAAKYWSRYFEVLETREPPQHSFQHWMICSKS